MKASKGSSAALAVVINSDDISDKRIISVNVMDADHVYVKTGFIGGPLSGGGEDLLLARSDSDEWVIEKSANWLS